jgi:hypothetical protein
MNIPKPKKQKPANKEEKKKEVQDSEELNEEPEHEPNVGLLDVDLKKFLGCGG